MTAMLRSQNIPCKLVVGCAGTTYHAWIDVYVEAQVGSPVPSGLTARTGP